MGMTTAPSSTNGLRVKRSLTLLGLLIAVAARAAEPTVEERLKALETQVQQLARENADLKKQLRVKDGAPLVLPQPAGKETKLVIGGFLQAQAEFGGAADSRFAGIRDRLYFRRARIYVAGSFAEDFDFKAELDLQGNTLSAGTGQLARANEIYINWRKYAFANVRFGQLKPAFGGESLTSDTHGLVIERGLASDRITDGRQLALSVGGNLADDRVNYTVMAGNGNGSNVSANDNSKFQRSARVVFTAFNEKDNHLTIGVDGLWTRDASVTKNGFGFAGNVFSGERHAWGIDADWKHHDFELTGEWLRGTFEPAGAVPAAKFDAEGWQLTAGYFVLPHQLQVVLRREMFDPNTSLGGDSTRSWTFGLNYLIKGDDLRLMADYIIGHGPGAQGDEGRLLTRFQLIF